ncbi:hypothetical protein [Nocardioides sp.]|uniref:hypothetical protein n=1 Tax=Nocardioides sp. TaxID=35761 RepID=UPI0031FEC3F2|nr:hypothetical protein [Nocardioides sp.]
MSSSLLALACAAALLATPTPTGSAGPAEAAPSPAQQARHCANGQASKTIADPGRDAEKGIDITALGVWNKDADDCYWVTVAGNFMAKRAQVIQVFYDTNRRRAGAEYQIFSYSPIDGDRRSQTYVVRLTDHGPVPFTCTTYRAFKIGKHQIRLGVLKGCLGNVAHLRVRVQLFDVTEYRSGNRWRGKYDQVPAGKWTPLV